MSSVPKGDPSIVSSILGETHPRPDAALPVSNLETVAGMLHLPNRVKLTDADIELSIGDQFLADDNATKSA
jgi:hypothetical protein